MARTKTMSGAAAGGSSRALREAWVDHPHYRYRGCAPDPDDPTRLAGDPRLPLGAHHAPDGEEPESQPARIAREKAAIEVCVGCPVMVACDAYASSVVTEGGTARVAEPEGVWGGRTALERHKAFIQLRHKVTTAASDDKLRTEQKLAVVAALARCWDPYEVAELAGLDVRTTNWQRSSLVREMALPKDCSRERLLEEAQRRGLLEGDFVRDGGRVPAVAPPTPQVRTEPAAPAPTAAPTVPARPDVLLEEDAVGASPPRTRLPAPRRDKFAAIGGQLKLWPDTRTTPSRSHARLEAAA